MAVSLTGDLVPKMSSDSVGVGIEFSWVGQGRAAEVWFSAGKRGLLRDYDQESVAYKQALSLPGARTPVSRSASQTIPLSFWGTRVIGDGAVEIVFKVPGMADVIVHVWNAFTVNAFPEAVLQILNVSLA